MKENEALSYNSTKRLKARLHHMQETKNLRNKELKKATFARKRGHKKTTRLVDNSIMQLGKEKDPGKNLKKTSYLYILNTIITIG